MSSEIQVPQGPTVVVMTGNVHRILRGETLEAEIRMILRKQDEEHLEGLDIGMLTDEELLRQNLRNLAEQAVRYTGELVANEDPFWYRRHGVDFKNDTFEMNSGFRKPAPFANFLWRDVGMRWNVRIGRELKLSRPLTRQEIVAMFADCLKSLH